MYTVSLGQIRTLSVVENFITVALSNFPIYAIVMICIICIIVRWLALLLAPQIEL